MSVLSAKLASHGFLAFDRAWVVIVGRIAALWSYDTAARNSDRVADVHYEKRRRLRAAFFFDQLNLRNAGQFLVIAYSSAAGAVRRFNARLRNDGKPVKRLRQTLAKLDNE